MILHTINKIAAEHLSNGLIGQDDIVVLIEDGLLLGLKPPSNPSSKIYAISADAQARGIQNKLNEAITLISYSEFVELSLEADKVVSWF
jgi:tRNA 2-thiouridine synthesizing protein B